MPHEKAQDKRFRDLTDDIARKGLMCKCYKAQYLPARLARRIDVQQLVKLLPERLLPEQHVNRKDQRDDAGKCKARQQLCHGKSRIKQAADALLEKFADLSEQGIPVDLHIFHVALRSTAHLPRSLPAISGSV